MRLLSAAVLILTALALFALLTSAEGRTILLAFAVAAGGLLVFAAFMGTVSRR